jgi:hypothetical protein
MTNFAMQRDIFTVVLHLLSGRLREGRDWEVYGNDDGE